MVFARSSNCVAFVFAVDLVEQNGIPAKDGRGMKVIGF